jgi:predicted RNase H-like HicB family nuclease
VADYPLILTLTFDIQGPEFLARVIAHGRALMATEEGEWWCHGVDPGGLTANGETPAAAFAAYKRAFLGILGDFAEEAQGFDAFKQAVEGFVADTDNNEARRWTDARDQIRSGTAVEAPFDDLKRVTDSVITTVEVSSLDRVAAVSEDVSLAESKAA